MELNSLQLQLTQITQSKQIKTKHTLDSRVSPTLAHLLYHLGCYVVLPIYFGNIEVIGRENIPLTEPVIVAPTHRSYWDALWVAYAVGRLSSGRDLRFMTSKDHVKAPIKGWFIRQLGGFPVDTKRPGRKSIHHSMELLSNREMLVMFPEGGIFRNQKINPLKRGIAHIALEVESAQRGIDVKILPLSIKYSQPYANWGTDVTIKIASPLNVGDYLSKSLRQSSQRLTLALKTALQEIHE